MKQAILAVLLFLSINATGQSQTRKVLFLGNSYTYVNDLPLIISELAVSTGDVLLYDSNLIGGYTLEGHSTNTVSQNKIVSDDWDYIVLQEQSQRPAFVNPIGFINGFSSLVSYIEQNTPCAQVSSFMTWGYENGDAQNCPNNPNVCTYDGMQTLLTDRYMYVSNSSESEVTPVGEVWRYIRENYPVIDLYQSDGSHPSMAGSYLAACCFYTSIFRKDPTLITDDYGLDATIALILRNATKSIVFDHQLDWYIGKYVPNADFYYTVGTGTNEIILNSNPSVYLDSLVWDFGDGTATSTVANPSHSYAADGSYTVQLTTYKCYLGQTLESTAEKTVSFCSHTNTIYPDDLLLCPNTTDTIWTQPADSYQWCDYYGNPIPGATNQYLEVGPGEYSVLTTLGGCTEQSPQIYVDSYNDFPGNGDCILGLGEIEVSDALMISPNPVHNVLSIQTYGNPEEILVYDLLGKGMEVNRISTHAVDVSNLVQGTYILSVKTGDGVTQSARFIKY